MSRTRKILTALGVLAGAALVATSISLVSAADAAGPGGPLTTSTGGHAICSGPAGKTVSGDGTTCTSDGLGNYIIETGTVGAATVTVTLSSPYVGWFNVTRPDSAHATIHVIRPDNRQQYRGPLEFDWLAAA
jgi:hypothetical protein